MNSQTKDCKILGKAVFHDSTLNMERMYCALASAAHGFTDVLARLHIYTSAVRIMIM